MRWSRPERSWISASMCGACAASSAAAVASCRRTPGRSPSGNPSSANGRGLHLQPRNSTVPHRTPSRHTPHSIRRRNRSTRAPCRSSGNRATGLRPTPAHRPSSLRRRSPSAAPVTATTSARALAGSALGWASPLPQQSCCAAGPQSCVACAAVFEGPTLPLPGGRLSACYQHPFERRTSTARCRGGDANTSRLPDRGRARGLMRQGGLHSSRSARACACRRRC
mmetsp:Transcript_74628/g.216524  ORF Transcript_74628/g.216524 Transcript_74628/m.216524 type:complete len:224 (+) Transcript_74628:2524-3195(+)